MPQFEYICKDCGLKFTVLSDRWDEMCPCCGSTNVTRQLSTFAFTFNPKL